MDAGPAHRTNEPAGIEDGAALYFGQPTPFRIFQLMKMAPHPREIHSPRHVYRRQYLVASSHFWEFESIGCVSSRFTENEIKLQLSM
jgi:hypothetical protein